MRLARSLQNLRPIDLRLARNLQNPGTARPVLTTSVDSRRTGPYFGPTPHRAGGGLLPRSARSNGSTLESPVKSLATAALGARCSAYPARNDAYHAGRGLDPESN